MRRNISSSYKFTSIRLSNVSQFISIRHFYAATRYYIGLLELLDFPHCLSYFLCLFKILRRSIFLPPSDQQRTPRLGNTQMPWKTPRRQSHSSLTGPRWVYSILSHSSLIHEASFHSLFVILSCFLSISRWQTPSVVKYYLHTSELQSFSSLLYIERNQPIAYKLKLSHIFVRLFLLLFILEGSITINFPLLSSFFSRRVSQGRAQRSSTSSVTKQP